MNQIDRAVEVLKQGGVIAYPTDTVYGIGCDILNEKAVRKVFELKGRDFSKPMSIACVDIAMAKKYISMKKYDDLSAIIERVSHLLPGPYTIILPKNSRISDLITAGPKMVGIRIPDNKLCLSIIKKFGQPIITTSANLSGEPDIKKYEDIILSVDFIVKGKCKYEQPSTIFDPINKKILRRGVGLNQIKKLLI